MADPAGSTRSTGPTGPTGPAAADRAQTDEERWYLTDLREFLRRSIADAEAEHEAGDLSPEDFALLTARDQHKLTEVEAELARLAPPAVADPGEGEGEREREAATGTATVPAPVVPRMPRWRLVGIVASCALIITGVVILVDHALSLRLPGQASSGSITQTRAQQIEQQLEEALTLDNQGQSAAALRLYDRVLAEDPTDPAALAGSGWVEWNAGASADSATVEAQGEKAEEKAIRFAPSFYQGHLYLGLILLYQDNDPTAAVAQFNKFLAESPPAAEVQAAASKLRDAYRAAGQLVPASVAAASG